MERQRESVAMMPTPGEAMLRRHRSSSGRWARAAIVVIAVAAAAAGVAHALGALPW
jgi:hypothetical protein